MWCVGSVFGSTVSLFAKEFAKFGVETSFVSQTTWPSACRDPAEHEAAVRRNTDQPADRRVRHRGAGRHRAWRGALLTVDNTFCSPALQRPLALAPTW